jgi:hypothetical protein
VAGGWLTGVGPNDSYNYNLLKVTRNCSSSTIWVTDPSTSFSSNFWSSSNGTQNTGTGSGGGGGGGGGAGTAPWPDACVDCGDGNGYIPSETKLRYQTVVSFLNLNADQSYWLLQDPNFSDNLYDLFLKNKFSYQASVAGKTLFELTMNDRLIGPYDDTYKNILASHFPKCITEAPGFSELVTSIIPSDIEDRKIAYNGAPMVDILFDVLIGYLTPASYDATKPFDSLSGFFNAPPEPIINNGITIEAIPAGAPVFGSPRIIARTTDRGNTEDLTYGTDGNTSGINPRDLAKTNNERFKDLQKLFKICTYFDHELTDVGMQMIEKFKTNTSNNTIFTNDVLNSKINESSEMYIFLKRVGIELQTSLLVNKGDISKVDIKMNNIRPIFNSFYNKFHGLQILINDTEYTEVQLDNFEIGASGAWWADVTVTVNDHFGVDKADALKYQSYNSGFSSWWILQHVNGFVPFKTKVIIRKRMIGNI